MFKKTFICILLMMIMLIIIKVNFKTEPMMKYFPIDCDQEFEYASTTLSYLPNNDRSNILWKTNSSTVLPQYLRQDVSLLYENGVFKGFQQKWQQNIAKMKLEKSFNINKAAILTAITFHHAEIHHEDETISSIQKMTSDKIYYLNHHFLKNNKSHSKEESKLINKMNHKTNQYLLTVWSTWMNDYEIDKDDYTLIPLIELIEYEEHPLHHFSMAETKKIIGQLWEGLYKNYMIKLIDGQEKNHHPMPIILLAKDDSHLIVLYEINHKNMKLIQQINES